ncbi:MAG: hypothetical protein CYPHOPRED_004339 [Cyphobasidiales sp. Tagirdzhanova-0007]|nr:MAG: hypothetical protein CYPHOPRED_004339 [Cyphobasidiales sp. Tagirdzhanova-0007]
MSGCPFPNPRRLVTGHDNKGNAIWLDDATHKPEPVHGRGDFGFSVLYRTEQFPADLSEPWQDPMKTPTTNLAVKDGVVFRVVDFPPKGPEIMHRTISLDFGIVMNGKISCILDDGAIRDLNPGDRGTIHAWRNSSESWARIYFVLTTAQPIKIDEKALPQTGYKEEEMSSGGK